MSPEETADFVKVATDLRACNPGRAFFTLCPAHTYYCRPRQLAARCLRFQIWAADRYGANVARDWVQTLANES